MFCRKASVFPVFIFFILGTSACAFGEKLMASDDVHTVQELLELQGFNPGLHTGTLTPETRSALRRYQSKHHLKKTGELDRATQDKMGVFVRMVENDPVLGITQEAREAAIREGEDWAATHPPKKAQPSIIRAKPTQ
jgi:peptidoglycan hydrolase-like protein with peptidoglycan-binding domain